MPTTPVRLVADYVVPGEGRGEVIAAGAVDVGADGRIIAVGAEASLGPARGRVERIGGMLIPGLINAHGHGPMTLVRSAGDGLPVQRWLREAIWPREAKMTPEDVWCGMALASTEMLLGGVTTSVEMYMHEDQLVDAAAAVGGRIKVMAGFISSLIRKDSAYADRLQSIADFCLRHRDDALATAGFGPHSMLDLTLDRAALLAEVASGVGAGVHIHLDETRAERAEVLDIHGRTATQLMSEVGLLDVPLLAAHGVWLEPDDLALLAQANAAIAHCPQSNLKLGSGLAPLAKMIEAGVTVGVGTDGAASNDNLDIWEELRLAPLLARGAAMDASAMSASRAFSLATKSGAEAVGLADIGELRAGMWADIVRLELDHPSLAPHVDADLFARLVWAGSAEHVSDVWVAGRRVVARGEITMIDRAQLAADATRRALRLLT